MQIDRQIVQRRTPIKSPQLKAELKNFQLTFALISQRPKQESPESRDRFSEMFLEQLFSLSLTKKKEICRCDDKLSSDEQQDGRFSKLLSHDRF